MKCPKCGSSEIYADKKGFSLGKAATGAALTGGIGLLAGFVGSSNVYLTCLSCGNKFKPGEGKANNFLQNTLSGTNNISVIKDVPQKSVFGNSESTQLQTDDTLSYKERMQEHKQKRGVKKEIAHSTINSTAIQRYKIICTCGSMNELHFKFCRVCGTKIDIVKMGTTKNGQSFEYDKCTNCNSLTPKASNKSKFCVNCGESLII